MDSLEDLDTYGRTLQGIFKLCYGMVWASFVSLGIETSEPSGSINCGKLSCLAEQLQASLCDSLN